MTETGTAGIQIERDVPLAPLTTLGVGGKARYFCRAGSWQEVSRAWSWADQNNLCRLTIGEGSNLLFDDGGYAGLLIQCSTRGIQRQGERVRVAGGENLPALIRWLNRQGLAGMERMYGIPGSVAGAVVGNAGAYGQEICQTLETVTAWSPGDGVVQLQSSELRLGYRHSLFKERRDLFLLDCLLRLRPSNGNLQQVSDSILEKREKKYPPGLKCPGSFFKNVVMEELDENIRLRIPGDFVMFGKIPAGKLLQEVGANGAILGDAAVASYHGNLFLNRGSASSADLRALACQYAEKVKERFGIRLEPEILIVDREGEIRGKTFCD